VADGEGHRSLAGVWSRIRGALPGGVQVRRVDAPLAEDAVRASKALRRLVELLRPVDAPAVLDLGPITDTNVALLGEHLGCKVYIHDLYSDLGRRVEQDPEASLAPYLSGELELVADASVDAVLAWDVVDYLTDAEAAAFVERIGRTLKPGGFVMAFFSTVLIDDFACRKYVAEDLDHLRHRRMPFARQPERVLLGRDVERLFSPLEVAESYLLTHHQRETLLRRPSARTDGGGPWRGRR
jgi:hypothetical protein